MKLLAKYIAVLASLSSLLGCVAQTHYVWSNYDTKLYSHYKDPSQKEEFYLALKETLDDAESSNCVPPGIYAEYGFLMYEQGNSLQAILYYQKEADKWPESRTFMTKMISVAQKHAKVQDTGSQPVIAIVDDKKQVVTVQPEATK